MFYSFASPPGTSIPISLLIHFFSSVCKASFWSLKLVENSSLLGFVKDLATFVTVFMERMAMI